MSEQTFALQSNMKPLIAGLSSGAASTVLLYPLDLIKVRLQVTESGRKRGIVRTLRQIVHYEGIQGLYQGLTPALMGSAISWGGYFFFYEEIKKELLHLKNQNETRNELGSLENFSAACLSGAIMVGFTNPIWLIKTRMQLQMKKFQEHQLKAGSMSACAVKIKPPYKNMMDAARTIVQEEGPLALYKGALPALLLVSHGGVQFVVYEYLKLNFGEYKKVSMSLEEDASYGVFDRLHDSLGYLTMGASSKIIASTVTYPIQVIKSRIQQRSQMVELTMKGDVEIVERQYKGILSASLKIYQNEGVFGFFKGALANAFRVAPSAAITFVVYETLMDVLR
jgi:solute carrier family 25 (mitochondrial folate transporter), member 32